MKKKGFTIVEVLIVIIILGILAAIVIPQFTAAAKEAEVVKEAKRSAEPYIITEREFGIFSITAFGVDPNYGYGEYLDQGLEELKERGLIIKDTAPISWKDGQVRAIWVRTKKQ